MSTKDDRIIEFSELIQDNRSRVFGFIYSMVLNLADAEDLFQQTASLLWEKFDEYESGTDFASWALKVARYKSANFIRARYRERNRMSSAAVESLYSASVAMEDSDEQERLEVLRCCLGKLSREDRELIERCYAGAAKIKDIAEITNVTPGSLYVALHRIRKALLKCVKKNLAVN